MPYFIGLRTALGIEAWATPEEMKKAYRKISIVYHPDRNKDCKKSEKMMKKITEAYEILQDSEKMTEYEKKKREEIRVAQKTAAKKNKVQKRRKKK